MSLIRTLNDQLEVAGHSEATDRELKLLRRTDEWADLRAGYPDPDTAIRDCADLVRSWRRAGAYLPTEGDDTPRVRARSLALYSMASEEPEVLAFRGDVLGGRVLPLTSVREWVEPRQPARTQRRDLPDLRLPVDELRVVQVKPGTVLGRLRDLAVYLSSTYRWAEDQAVAFVLCDVVPAVSGVWVTETRSSTGDRITLDVDPSVPPDVVRARYAEAQRELTGKRHRAPNPESLDVLSEWVLRGEPEFREMAHRWSRERGVERDRNWCGTTIARAWRAVTGSPLVRSAE